MFFWSKTGTKDKKFAPSVADVFQSGWVMI